MYRLSFIDLMSSYRPSVSPNNVDALLVSEVLSSTLVGVPSALVGVSSTILFVRV